MPTGKYVRTPEQLEIMRKNFEKGRTDPEVRKKQVAALKKNAESKEWRAKVGEKTKEAIRNPEIRQRHLEKLAEAWGMSLEPNPLAPEFRVRYLNVTTEEYYDRFWSRVLILEDLDSCWNWQKGTSSGEYGIFWNAGSDVRTNRFVLMLQLGRILIGDEQALHTCDNSHCCNPKHIYLGDNVQNVKDRVERGRHSKTHVTNIQKYQILSLYQSGKSTPEEICGKFNISMRSFRNLINRNKIKNGN